MSSLVKMDLTHIVQNEQHADVQNIIAWLEEYVVGQNEAKQAIAEVLIHGLAHPCRDQGVLGAVFLAGPTGVGKTELARALANMLFGNPDAFTRICGETMVHPMDVSKLVGSPAGYVGYGDAPQMADTQVHKWYQDAKRKNTLHPLIKNTPNFSIVLVEEIEKAHYSIPNTFLNALQSGKMEMMSWHTGRPSGGMTHSRETNLANTLFLFTSNVGEQQIQQENTTIGFTQSQSADANAFRFQKELRRTFAPEFLGRMNRIVRCHAISEEHVHQAFQKHLGRFNARLERKNIPVQVATTETYNNAVLQNHECQTMGIRAITHIVQRIGMQVGLVLRGNHIPTDQIWTVVFDYTGENEIISYVSDGVRLPTKISVTPTEKMQQGVDAMVSRQCMQYSRYIAQSVKSLLDMIQWYDTAFYDSYHMVRKKLFAYGFSVREIDQIELLGYSRVYHAIEQPQHFEVIIRHEHMFQPRSFRTIEKIIRHKILRTESSVESIYSTIAGFLKRPLTRDEAEVVWQHIYRILHTLHYPKK